MNILNIASYKFIHLAEEELQPLKDTFEQKGKALSILGTILLSQEGINLYLAGDEASIRQYMIFLAEWPFFNDLTYKESYSDEIPFKHLFVKVKDEIIAFGESNIDPEKKPAPYITPKELKQWYDENHDMVILDTRNEYELQFGYFENAINLHLDTFKQFPEAIKAMPESFKEKTIITYCTGGIRCEKAAIYLKQQGYKNVYQLEGGILNYFKECQDNHYLGECFVFDNRISIPPVPGTTCQAQEDITD